MEKIEEMKEKANRIVCKLEKLFNCGHVHIVVKKNLVYGHRAYYYNGSIFISEKVDDGSLEGTVLHEFAHHLQFLRRRYRKLFVEAKRKWEKVKKFDFGYSSGDSYSNNKRKEVRRNKWHDKEFAYILKEVVKRYYEGDISKYNIKEYKTVEKYLRYKGN
jgi:predicted SprT family Zn-dependent metalloprotease